MLFNVHVSPAAVLQTAKSQAGFDAPALQAQLMDLLRRHGLLRFTSKAEADQWLNSVKSPQLSPAEQKKWQELILSMYHKGRVVAADPAWAEDPDSAQAPKDLQGLTTGAPIVSVASTATYSRVFPEAETGITEAFPGLEVSVPGSISESKLYRQRADLLETGSFAPGIARDTVWLTLFAPFAAVSSEIVLFDKYLFSKLAERPWDEHVGWILKSLDKHARQGASVKLIGARGLPGQYGSESVPSDPDAAEQMLKDTLPDRFERLGSVEILLAESVKATHMHHDRHVRFSSGAAFEIPSGFDRLAYPSVREGFGFTYRWTPESLRTLEERERTVLKGRGTRKVQLAF